jgi:anaerobic selenocysteine-containing dehydrogenase
MTVEHIYCQRCGEFFISHEMQQKILKIAKEKGLDHYQSHFELCQRCRAQAFVDQLVGDRLERVDRVKHVAKRRHEELRPVKKDLRLGTTVYKSECFICNQGCDAQIHVKDGKVVRVEGDPSSALTKGSLCSKGLSSKELLYHPDRLLYPLKRLGARGEGNWERISWDEALDAIAKKLFEIEGQYGKDSIVLAKGTSRGWAHYFTRFANAYGKQWIGPGIAQCLSPRITGQ